MLDWSYDLLSDAERAVFRRASVFVGSWGIEAMEAVCSGGDVAPADVLDLLQSLVNQSLVVVEVGDVERRYRLLETVRVYASEMLAATGEDSEIRRKHSVWYLDLVKPVGHIPWGTRQEDWFTSLETNLTNVRAALDWCLAHEPADVAAEIVKHLAQFWQIRGYYAAGRRYFEQILRRPDLRSESRTQILGFAAQLAQAHGDLTAAFLLAEEGRLLAQDTEDERGGAICNLMLASIATDCGEHDSAISLVTRSIDFWRKDGTPQIEAVALGSLVRALSAAGRNDEAIHACKERTQLARKLGNVHLEAVSLMQSGISYIRHGDHLQATASLLDALPLFRQILAHVNIAVVFEYLGCAAVLARDYRRALYLFGAAEQFRECLNFSLSPAAQIDSDRMRSLAVQHVDPETYSALLLKGRALTIDAATQLAYEHAEDAAPESISRQQRHGILTPRECEVAALVARGYTNRQIAATLIITERTAETHTRNIREKLGFTSRAQIASWATTNGLTFEG
jgi:non-specific serine/threonine protein kinase